MTATTTVGCRGLNHRDTATLTRCPDCGHDTFRTHKGYLANARLGRGGLTYSCWDAHQCTPAALALHAAVQAEQRGETNPIAEAQAALDAVLDAARANLAAGAAARAAGDADEGMRLFEEMLAVHQPAINAAEAALRAAKGL